MALIGLIACSHTSKTYYEIRGRIEGVDEGTLFSLFRINGEAGMAIDHDTLRDGRLLFRVKPEGEGREHMTILCWNEKFPNMALHLWAEAGDCVQIEGEGALIHTWRVKGPAPENRSHEGYINCARELYDSLQRITIAENQLRLNGAEQGIDHGLLQAQYDSLGGLQMQLIPPIHERLIGRMRSVEMDEIGLMFLKEMATMWRYDKEGYPHREAVVELYNGLGEQWFDHPTVKEIGALLLPVAQVGRHEPMVDGAFYDLEGQPHTLGELRGGYILLDFWSAGCGPCIMALEEMGEIAKRYAGLLQVVSITTDTDNMWRTASEQHPISWHNWSDGKQRSGIYPYYDQQGIPSYTLISPEGLVIDQWMGYGTGSLHQKIAEHISMRSE